MKVLLEKGAYVDPINEMDYTALMEGLQMGDKELVGLFFGIRANVHFQNEDTMTPLKVSKSDEVAEMLKSKGALQ
jgi:hypothetical protein